MWLLGSIALAGTCSLTDGIWLLTVEPGGDPQTIFGHTAVLDYATDQGGYSPVYDYGRFTVDPLPVMAWEVLTMQKPYSMGSASLDDTIARYDRLGRGIIAQRLDLPPARRVSLQRALAADLSIGGDFPYNWYRPNCTTRVQDRLDEALDGALRDAWADPGTSPADEVLRHSAPHVPLWLGLRWGSGRVAHQPVSRYDAAFLPDGFMHALDGTTWNGRPLVAERCVLGAVEPTPVPERGPRRWLPLGIVGLATAGGLTGLAGAKRGLALAVVALLGTLLGLWGSAALLVGSLGTFAPFWGHHNLTLASPLSFALVGAAWAARRDPSSETPARIAAALLGLAVLGTAWSLVAGDADQNLGLALALVPALVGAQQALRPRVSPPALP